MRVYQGVDLVEVTRVKKAFERRDAFQEDIFTEGERAYCLGRRNPYPHFAARFAAKEACLKAFGLGLSGPDGLGGRGRLREIEVASAASGKPALRLRGSMARMSARKKIAQVTVSLSHTLELAMAQVILTGEGAPGEAG